MDFSWFQIDISHKKGKKLGYFFCSGGGVASPREAQVDAATYPLPPCICVWMEGLLKKKCKWRFVVKYFPNLVSQSEDVEELFTFDPNWDSTDIA